MVDFLFLDVLLRKSSVHWISLCSLHAWSSLQKTYMTMNGNFATYFVVCYKKALLFYGNETHSPDSVNNRYEHKKEPPTTRPRTGTQSHLPSPAHRHPCHAAACRVPCHAVAPRLPRRCSSPCPRRPHLRGLHLPIGDTAEGATSRGVA